jgi:AcrR family transcriptional regulator
MAPKPTSSKAKATPYHHGDLRRALLEASLELLESGGVDALTLRSVAAKAGVSHAAPYRHFADRNALLTAVNEQAFSDLQQVLARAAEEVPKNKPRERLLKVAQRYVEYALAHPAPYQLMFGGPRVSEGAAGSAPSATFDFVEGLVRACQAQRCLRSGSATRYASMIWSIVHGVASLALNDRLDETDTPARMARDATDAFLSGMAPA